MATRPGSPKPETRFSSGEVKLASPLKDSVKVRELWSPQTPTCVRDVCVHEGQLGAGLVETEANAGRRR